MVFLISVAVSSLSVGAYFIVKGHTHLSAPTKVALKVVVVLTDSGPYK